MKYPITILSKPYLETYNCTSIMLFPGDVKVPEGLKNIVGVSIMKDNVEFVENITNDQMWHSQLYKQAEASWLLDLVFNINEVDY